MRWIVNDWREIMDKVGSHFCDLWGMRDLLLLSLVVRFRVVYDYNKLIPYIY